MVPLDEEDSPPGASAFRAKSLHHARSNCSDQDHQHAVPQAQAPFLGGRFAYVMQEGRREQIPVMVTLLQQGPHDTGAMAPVVARHGTKECHTPRIENLTDLRGSDPCTAELGGNGVHELPDAIESRHLC